MLISVLFNLNNVLSLPIRFSALETKLNVKVEYSKVLTFQTNFRIQIGFMITWEYVSSVAGSEALLNWGCFEIGPFLLFLYETEPYYDIIQLNKPVAKLNYIMIKLNSICKNNFKVTRPPIHSNCTLWSHLRRFLSFFFIIIHY